MLIWVKWYLHKLRLRVWLMRSDMIMDRPDPRPLDVLFIGDLKNLHFTPLSPSSSTYFCLKNIKSMSLVTCVKINRFPNHRILKSFTNLKAIKLHIKISIKQSINGNKLIKNVKTSKLSIKSPSSESALEWSRLQTDQPVRLALMCKTVIKAIFS